MSSTFYTEPPDQARPRLGGVCAVIADASTVPTWIIRLAALVLALNWPIITLLVYLALAIGLHRRRNRLNHHLGQWHNHLTRMTSPPPNPFSSVIDRLANHFATLDQRLANLERTMRPRHTSDSRYDR